MAMPIVTCSSMHMWSLDSARMSANAVCEERSRYNHKDLQRKTRIIAWLEFTCLQTRQLLTSKMCTVLVHSRLLECTCTDLNSRLQQVLTLYLCAFYHNRAIYTRSISKTKTGPNSIRQHTCTPKVRIQSALSDGKTSQHAFLGN